MARQAAHGIPAPLLYSWALVEGRILPLNVEGTKGFTAVVQYESQ